MRKIKTRQIDHSRKINLITLLNHLHISRIRQQLKQIIKNLEFFLLVHPSKDFSLKIPQLIK